MVPLFQDSVRGIERYLSLNLPCFVCRIKFLSDKVSQSILPREKQLTAQPEYPIGKRLANAAL
jgi:hypothetical protein